MPPSATVLMAVYNSEKLLSGSLESVLGQTHDDFELLVVDDASTDDTLAIVQEYALRDDRITVLRNESNLGLGACLAAGVEAAQGEVIVRIDADDHCFPDRLERQLCFLREHPDVDVVGGAAIEINDAGREGGRRRMPEMHEEIVRSIWACPFVHPTVAFRRQRILDVGNYDARLRRRQDYELWFRCAKAGLRFHNLQEPVIYYRFDANAHKKQPLRLAMQQAGIGLAGCKMLGLPWWQYMAVTVPAWRALLPGPLRHLVYRLSAVVDPRRKVVNDGQG